MKVFATILLSAVFVLGGGLDAISARLTADGRWLCDDGTADPFGTLLAIRCLEASGGETHLAAALRARSAVLLSDEVPEALPEALLQALAPQPPEWDTLAPYRDDTGGWCLTSCAFPDVLSTIWALRFMLGDDTVPDGWPESAVAFLLAQANPDGTFSMSPGAPASERLTLFANAALALAKSLGFTGTTAESCSPHLEEHPEGIPEQALAARALCLTGEWERAIPLRERLLAAESDGWGEAQGCPFDLIATCLALEALDCFTISIADAHPDLEVPASSAILSGDGALSVIVFNNGDSTAVPFKVVLQVPGDNTPLATINLPALTAGRAARADFTFDLPDKASALLVTADPDGVNNDPNRDDNSIIIPLSDTSVLALSPIMLDGASPDDVLFLGPGIGAELTVTIFHHALIGALTCEWQDNNNTFASALITPDDDGVTLIRQDWFPTEAEHTVSFSIKGGPFVTFDTSVAYNDAVINTFRSDNGTLTPAQSFQAREYVTCKVLSALQSPDITVSVTAPDGTPLGQALADNGTFQWHTTNHAPGTYIACAELRDPHSNILLATAETLFDITPTCTFDKLQIIEPTDLKLNGKQSVSTTLSAQWNAIANSDVTTTLSWKITSPTGDIILTQSADVLTDSAALIQLFNIPLTATFTEYGIYTLTLALGSCTDTTTVKVTSPPQIILQNYATPTIIGTEAAAVTTVIRLSAAEEPANGLPASFTVADAPLTLNDDDTDSITVRLINFKDAADLPAADFTIAVITPYGRLNGKSDLAPQRTEGDVTTVDVINTTATFTFSPTGNALLPGEHATIPLAVMLLQNNLPDSRIGTVEIHLEKSSEETTP